MAYGQNLVDAEICFYKMAQSDFALLDFFKRYGTDTTTNFQLMKWAKELKITNFHVLMRDEIKIIKKKSSCSAICNLHTKEQDGVHWSCLYKTPEISYYFGSYGLIPTKEVEAVLSKPYIYSTFQLQTNEKFCGVLCLYVLYELSNGGQFEDIVLDIYDSLNFNEPAA